MQRSYRYRIYPNQMQREAFLQTFDFCRLLYNCALEERINFYHKYKKILSSFDQIKELTQVKERFPSETSQIHSQVLQQVIIQLDKAYQNFFRKIKENSKEPGFPRFKGSNRFRSICFPQVQANLISGTGGGVKRLPNDKIKISGIPGELKILWHRPLQGRCKQARIIKQGEQFFISFSCDNVASQPLPKTGKVVAIDLGLNNFITQDDGTRFHHPKPYKTAREKLAWLNRRLALKQRGSNNRKKAVVALQRHHTRVFNIRDDFQHKLANKIIKENDVIVLEKLNIVSMLEAKGFEVSKGNIAEASWGNFVAKLIYKAESAGKLVIQVDPRNTSRTCSACQKVKEKLSLKDRKYGCEGCGFVIDRDQNAALNIRRLGTSHAEYKAYQVSNALQKSSALC